MKKYSLWVMPEGDIHHQLFDLTTQLSKEYLTPMFEPHLTLLWRVSGSERELVAQTERLAKVIQPYEVVLNRVDYLDDYFKCLFVTIEETKEVMGANITAKEVFHDYNIDPQKDASYRPHLSLMYGDFPLETKKSIVAKIGKELRLNFKAESIHLFFTTGEVKDWYRVKEFRMKYK